MNWMSLEGSWMNALVSSSRNDTVVWSARSPLVYLAVLIIETLFVNSQQTEINTHVLFYRSSVNCDLRVTIEHGSFTWPLFKTITCQESRLLKHFHLPAVGFWNLSNDERVQNSPDLHPLHFSVGTRLKRKWLKQRK